MKNNNICKFNINRSSDLICTDFVYETDNAQKNERHADQYILGLTIEGKGELSQYDRTYALSKGYIFFVQKGERFFVKGDKSFSYFYICFHGRRADELIERLGFGEDFCAFDTAEQYGQLSAFGLDCLHKANDNNLDMLSESVLLYLLAHLSNRQKSHNDLITAMIRITNDRFDDVTFSLSAMARELGYDAKYLSFTFKKKKGICYTQYLRDLRLRHAVFLMEQGVVSVKNIAVLSGFGDALYFSKVFKQTMGISPKGYIENLQKT